MKRALSIAAAAMMLATPAVAANTATLDWGYTSNDPANDNPTFTVYQGLQGQPKTAGPTTTAKTLTISAGLASGKTYCWAVTASVGANESLPSNEACKTFPPIPATPATLTAK
jgi:hypothetical protein